jgi:hypothetical protein
MDESALGCRRARLALEVQGNDHLMRNMDPFLLAAIEEAARGLPEGGSPIGFGVA